MTKRLTIVYLAGWAFGGILSAQPIIREVVDATGYTANIAQGGIFVVKGSSLGPPGLRETPSLPYGTLLADVRVTITPPGSSNITDVFIVNTYNAPGVSQVVAIVPSNLATGAYDVRVVYAGATSAPFRTNVVARKFGINTQDATGGGQASVQNQNSAAPVFLNRFTRGTRAGVNHSPAHPGDVITIWGTGLGAVLSGADNIAPGVQDLRGRATIRVLIGGQSIAPDFYAGRSPQYAGADQIVLTLPANAPTGCAVSLLVSVDGQLSNATTMAIAPAGADACVSRTYSRDTLTRLDQGGFLTIGTFSLSSIATTISTSGNVAAKVESAFGAFSRFTDTQLASASTFANEPGVCQVLRRIGDQKAIIFGGSSSNVDAGSVITLEGPRVSATNNQLKRIDATNTYDLPLATLMPNVTGTPVVSEGTYRLRGTGGNGILGFEAQATLGPPITFGAVPSTINRSQPLNLSWSGGAPGDRVQIIGVSGVATDNTATPTAYDAAVFFCTTTNTGSFSVSPSVLSQLPATPSGAAGLGVLMLLSNSMPASSNGQFTAPMLGGGSIDAGVFLGTVGSQSTTSYQ